MLSFPSVGRSHRLLGVPSGKDDMGKLLKPGEVALIFGVDPKTVTRWANEGKLLAIKTPGGHFRIDEDDLRSFLTKTRPNSMGGRDDQTA